MKVQNIDSSNTLHTGEPACGTGRASRLWAGTCQDLQLTQPPFRKDTCSRTPSGSSGNNCGFYALEFESQCRSIKVSAWGRFGFWVLDIECWVGSWILDLGFRFLGLGFGMIRFGILDVG